MAEEIEGTTCTIRRNGRVVGGLGIEHAERDGAKAALEAAGYQCDCGSEANFKTECTEDDPEVCEVSVALIYGLEIARDTGTPAPELEALNAAGHGGKGEVAEAFEALRDRLPEGSEERMEAEATLADLARGEIVTQQVSD